MNIVGDTNSHTHGWTSEGYTPFPRPKEGEEKIAGVIFVTTNITTASNDNNTNNNTHSKDNNCHRHCIDNIFSSNYHAEHKHTKASLGVL